MIWKLRNRSVNLSRTGLIMGVLNVTPDSFSDGGQFIDEEAAFCHAVRMVEEGAAILDIGGESSRPGSEPVAVEEELRRVIPVIQRIRARFPDLLLSIDTYKAETARQALASGADILNDISALRADREMIEVLQHSESGVIVMHMRGTPKTMQIDPHYRDVVGEVFEFLRSRRDELVRRGIDPAISRKSMIAHLLGDPKLQSKDRMWPTVALTSLLREKGAQIFRVHDVRPNLEALRMTEAILSDD
jgi:dihydropteroate synthase